MTGHRMVYRNQINRCHGVPQAGSSSMHIIRTCNQTYKLDGWLAHSIFIPTYKKNNSVCFMLVPTTQNNTLCPSIIGAKKLNNNIYKQHTIKNRLNPKLTPSYCCCCQYYYHPYALAEGMNVAEVSNCKIAALIARLLAVFRELGIDGGFPFRCFAKRVVSLVVDRKLLCKRYRLLENKRIICQYKES